MAESFSTESPNLQGFLKSLNLLENNVNTAVRKSMHDGAEIILKEQKRLVSNHPRLVKHITAGQLRVSKNGRMFIDCGYSDKAFQTVEGKTNMGVYGVSVEFGRPGKGKRSKKTMNQIRYGKQVEVDKGSIQPQSHIIRGFENKASEVANAVINSVNKELNKFEAKK